VISRRLESVTGAHPANITGFVSEPARNPVACGALGPYDGSIVARIASALPSPPREVHADRRSCLWLDREPIRWRAGPRGGLAWSERYPAPDPGGVRSWVDAATALDACGLGLGLRRRWIHSSVAGSAPVYWTEHDGATYFASRIDALARGIGAPLDADWDAWSAIFTLRQPLGDRTPFRQIRRLPQLSCLEHGSSGPAVRSEPWAWAEVEPHADIEAAVDATVEALHEALRPLRSSGAVVLLSGGLDSRAMLGVAHDAGVPVRALTAVADDGIGWEADLAGAAAAAAGAEHERFIPADGGDYRRLWSEHLEALDFQFMMGSWVMPMGPRLEELGLPTLDGLALDVLGIPGGRFYSDRRLIDPDPNWDFRSTLFKSFRARAMPKVPDRAFEEPLARAMVVSARRQFREQAAAYLGNRSQALLTVYSTRTVRAVAAVPAQVTGRHAPIVTPAAYDRAGRAILSLDPREKLGRRFYHALFDRIESPSVRLPTVEDATRPPPNAKGTRQRFSPEMLAMYETAVREGPLSAHLSRPLAGHLGAGTLADGIRGTSMHRAAMALTALHRWADRYDALLRPIDPSPLLEGSP
jgi:hypothetical protein